MSKNICPECGEPMEMGQHVCSNCQYELTNSEYQAMNGSTPSQDPQEPAPSTHHAPAPSAPDSVMAHGNVDVSNHHTEDKSTHNIDQSHTVNTTNQTVTNTFIIMGNGNAPIPPNIDPQTAAALKQAQRQPSTPTPAAQAAPISGASDSTKGIGAIDSNAVPVQPVARRRVNNVIAIAVAVALVAGICVFLFVRLSRTADTPVVATSTEISASTPDVVSTTPAKKTGTRTTTTTSSQTSDNKSTAMVTTQAPVSKPATPKPVNHYEEGMNYLDKGDYANALHHLKIAAQANNGDAAYQLGEMYMNGTGVAANKDEAVKWYKIAAKAGNKAAKRKLF